MSNIAVKSVLRHRAWAAVSHLEGLREKVAAHHDALEFPDGRQVLLTLLCEGQQATVLQMPAQPKTTEEAAKLRRVDYVG